MVLYNAIDHFEVIWGGKYRYALWTPQIKQDECIKGTFRWH
jgi:hypothetical protein